MPFAEQLQLLVPLQLFLVLLVVQRVLDIRQAVVVLEQAEQNLELRVLNRVPLDIQVLQIRVFLLGERGGDDAQAVRVDLAVLQVERRDCVVLVDHVAELLDGVLRSQVIVGQVEGLQVREVFDHFREESQILLSDPPAQIKNPSVRPYISHL